MPSYLFGKDLHHIEQSEIDSVTLTECWRRYAFHQPPAPDREPLRETRKRMRRRPGQTEPQAYSLRGMIMNEYTPREMIFIREASERRYHYSHIAAAMGRTRNAVRLRMARSGLPRVRYSKELAEQHRAEVRNLLIDIFAKYTEQGGLR